MISSVGFIYPRSDAWLVRVNDLRRSAASPVTGHVVGDGQGLQVTAAMALTELAVTWPIILLTGV